MKNVEITGNREKNAYYVCKFYVVYGETSSI